LSQITFLNLLRQFQAKGRAQFIIATHSPILLACPGAQILSFDSSHIEEVEYEDTLHFKLYRQFFTERAALLSV
jgi:predicted ATPase